MTDGRLRGDLVQNGGFEQGLTSWTTTNVGLENKSYAHEGLLIAAMGKPDPTALASMYQDVPVNPGRFYKLYAFVAGNVVHAGDLTVDIRWLNASDGDLGPAIPTGPVTVPGATTGAANNGAWKWLAIYTTESPPDAAHARIRFDKTTVANVLLVDDVVFADQS